MHILNILSVILLGITFLGLGRCELCDKVGEIRSENLEIMDSLSQSYAQICLQQSSSLEWSHICSEQTSEGFAWPSDNGYVWCRSMKRIPQSDHIGSITASTYGVGDIKLASASCDRIDHEDLYACNHTTTTEGCRYLHGLVCVSCSEAVPCNGNGSCSEGMCECNNNCMNGGFCDLGICQCRYPYYGENCEYKYCVSSCNDNEFCLNSSGTCICKDSYYGDSCQYKICPDTCGEKGECNNQTGLCQCEPNYFGITCQSKNCTPSCSQNGTCDETVGLCQCNAPYYGNSCQYLGINCTNKCLNRGICNFTNAMCECSANFRGNSCEIALSRFEENIVISIGILACTVVILIGLVVLVVIMCIVIKRRKRGSKQNGKIKNIELSEDQIQASQENITESKTNIKPKRKLKDNKTYIKSLNSSKGTEAQMISLNQNGNNFHASTTSSPYTQLGTLEYISYEREEVHAMFLNGDRTGEELYEAYTRINDSILPSRNATIVLSQEERDSIHSQNNEPIYETCLRRGKDTNVVKFSDSTEYCEPPDNLPKIFDRMSLMKFREINPDTLEKLDYLGSGEFGIVYKGIWDTGREKIDVAMKILKSSDEGVKTAFMREAAIMGQFSHPNILKLMGVLSLSEPFMIVTEYMNGDLPKLLINLKPSGINFSLIPPVLLKFCNEIVTGMEYLASKNCVHRDLAARNVLLSRNMVCKIADFGMSREFKENYDYYKCSGGLIPVKWTAPESIFYQRYSEKSDVWAFGMTMFEIWSLGYKPWHNKSNEDILQKMQSRQVMHPPTGCPKEIYAIMLETWKYEVDERITFKLLRQLLRKPIQFQTNTSSHPADVLGNDPSLVRGFD
ncbi:hypothetical protein LOD99_433 [Oopsacas minuta]|uniref:Receptor protein-tyrosine kinase n=1 Tax=Oopsacas minuta TaxID=111878 RepID=A0AAV7K948_9METZ|nr:hypothetical protein LOD99_433 [Oopsacas minuta]